jgi:rhamnogalacturonan acetylesterase
MRVWNVFISVALALAAVAPGQTPASVPRPGMPTLFVIGDSTANLPTRQGWGDPFADYFDPGKITVLNRARGGRSARTFFDEGLWKRVLEELKPGDYVLIQFGHNDGGIQPTGRADLPGTGDETKQSTIPDGKTELVHTFGWYIRRFVQDAEAKGAHPIVLSITVRDAWRNGKVERGLSGGQFGRWSQEVAEAEGVPFVDVTNIVADTYEKMGPQRVRPLFTANATHTTPAGADLTASLIVAGLKGIRSPLVELLSAKGQAVAAAQSMEGTP